MSALARDRSINFCKLRTCLRSPACDAVKMRCRRCRTSPSTRGQLIDPHSRASPSGPFTSAAMPPLAPNLSFGSGSSITGVLTGSPDPRQHPFGSGQPPVSGQLCEATGGGPVSCPDFLLPFGYRHSLPRSSDPRWETGLSLRSAYRARRRARIPSRFPRCTRTRCDRGGCLLYLGGGGAHPADKKSPAGACRFPAASPCTPPEPIGEAHA